MSRSIRIEIHGTASEEESSTLREHIAGLLFNSSSAPPGSIGFKEHRALINDIEVAFYHDPVCDLFGHQKGWSLCVRGDGSDENRVRHVVTALEPLRLPTRYITETIHYPATALKKRA